MVEKKRIGFGPGSKETKATGDIFIPNGDIASVKKFLEDSLAETRQREGSAENETNIDLTRNLINQIDDAASLINLLGTVLGHDLVVPGQNEFEKTKKRKLGFEVPEKSQDISASE